MSARKSAGSQPAAKVRAVQELRRSSAARPHRNKRRYHRPSEKRSSAN